MFLEMVHFLGGMAVYFGFVFIILAWTWIVLS
jgi:hypothetical protein